LAGCTQTPPAPTKPVPPDPSSVRFDAATGEVEAFSVNAQRGAGDWPAAFPVTLDAAGSPPILGTYTARGPYVRFRPRFPFVPGQAYRAEFRAGPDGPAVTKFTIPKPPPPPTVQVAAVYPSADRLPENLLRLYLHFTGPMRRGEVYDHVKLLTEQGKPIESPFLEIGEELWDSSGRRLTLLLDPGRVKQGLKPHEDLGPVLEAGKGYVLVIDAGWHDAHGRPLGKEFRKSFRAEAAAEKAIDPAAWKLRPPKAGTRAPLAVTFPAPLDHALLERVVAVSGPGGQAVAGRAVVVAGETGWTFTPDADWAKGAYELVAGPELEDVAGNRIGRPFEVDVWRQDETGRPAHLRFVVE
jgi:hypothetical protein